VSDAEGILGVETTPANRVRAAAAFPPLLGAVAMIVGAASWPAPFSAAVLLAVGLVFLFSLCAASLALAPLLSPLLRRREEGTLDAFVDHERVLIGDSVRLRTDDLAVAWMPKPNQVEIVARGGDEHLVSVSGPEAGERLVRRLRAVAPRTRSYPVSLGTGGGRVVRAMAAGVVMVGASLFLLAGPEAVPVLLGGAALGALLGHGRGALRFGADGVHVEGRFRSRYVPYRDIARVELGNTSGATTWLTLRTLTGRISLGSFLPTQRARLVAALLEEGVAMVRCGAEAGAHVAELDPTEADPVAWTDRLRHVLETQDYRAVAVDAGRLLGLLRNPAAEPRQRVAAALALRHTEGGLARIRVAADVSTDPEVQRALSALAEEHVAHEAMTDLVRRFGVA